MEIRKLGSLDASVLALGCNNFGTRCDESASRAVVEAACQAGVTVFDTAAAYGGGRSEEILGASIATMRDEVVVVTKFGVPFGADPDSGGASADRVRLQAEASLRRLGTDRIDLYLQHVPDPSTPLAETLGALTDLVDSGKVVEVGCCNVDRSFVTEALALAEGPGAGFVAVQNHYNLLQRSAEHDVLALCEDSGLGFMPYFPLESGFLTGKYHRAAAFPDDSRFAAASPITQDRIESITRPELYDHVEALARVPRAHGGTLVDLALSWLASRPAVACVLLLPDWLTARGAGSAVVGALHSLTQAFMGVNSTEVTAGSFFDYLRVTAGRGRHGIPPEGSRRLAENLADFIDAHGGSVRLGAGVTSIRMGGGRVLGVDVRGEGAVDGDVVVSDVGVEATDRLLPERMPSSADGPLAPSAPGITSFVATRTPLLDHPVVVVSGTRAVCLLTTPTLVAPELAPPGWHYTESISTFRSSLDAAAPTVELERHHADLDDLVPRWREGRVLHTATYRNNWPVYRAWPGRDRQERFPLPGLALVGDAVKPQGWPGTGASAEGARLVVDELVRGAADPSG